MTPGIMRAIVAISDTPELMLLLKATAILLAGLGAVWLLRRAAASVHALVLAVTFAVLALLPLGVLLAPPLVVPLAVAPVGMVERQDDLPAERAVSVAAGRSNEAPFADDFTVSPVAPRAFEAGRVLRTVWIVGVALVLLPLALTLWRMRSIRRTGVTWVAGETLARRIAGEAGVRHRIAVLRHEAVAVPMTCGLRHPVLLLPWDGPAWSADDLERAFVHGDRARTPRRLAAARAGARRLRRVLVPSARLGGSATPAPRRRAGM